jgi:hypothetical protein
MKNALKRFAPVLFVLALFVGMATAQDRYSPRAMEDIKSFLAKAEEGDGLFNQKKYAQAAAALAAAQESYLRAQRREAEIGYYKISLKPGTFPALRYYGYGFGPNPNLEEKPTGAIEGSAANLQSVVTEMWQDAAILGGLDKFPVAGALSEPPMVEMSEESLNSVMESLFGPVSRFTLPVPDREWGEVVFCSRRALLVMEYALEKYPQWKTGTHEWGKVGDSFQHTGNAALADVKAKLAEAEPEYAKIVSDAKNAAPSGAKDWIGYKVDDINNAIAGVKKNGYMQWGLARDIFITKDYVSGIRKSVASMYEKDGKSMPADALKPLEDKIAELKSAIDQGASRWKFPSGNAHNPTIEAKVAASLKSRFPGATVLKTALDSSEWIITKNELDIPRYRSLGVLALVKIPGQSQPWQIFGYYRQTYTGGGTYSSGGSVEPPSDVRIQSGR